MRRTSLGHSWPPAVAFGWVRSAQAGWPPGTGWPPGKGICARRWREPVGVFVWEPEGQARRLRRATARNGLAVSPLAACLSNTGQLGVN